jgi:hypothetical protein
VSAMASTATEAAAKQQQQANGNGEQKTRHSEVGHKSLLKSDDLYQVRAPAVSVIRSIRPSSWSPDRIFSMYVGSFDLAPTGGLIGAVHLGDERVPT